MTTPAFINGNQTTVLKQFIFVALLLQILIQIIAVFIGIAQSEMLHGFFAEFTLFKIL